MVVEESTGTFVAQRPGSSGIGVPALFAVQPTVTKDRLRVVAPGMDELTVPLGAPSKPSSRAVRVWKRHLVAVDEGDEAAGWFTRYLAPHRPGKYRLVRMRREAQDEIGFVDDAALHVLSEASLADLNARLAQPVPMDRFRPSLVVRGAQAYAEDHWDSFETGGIRFTGGAFCTRCALTTIDQKTGVSSVEPLRTLARYRKAADGVRFGRYFKAGNAGRLRVGAAIEALRPALTPS